MIWLNWIELNWIELPVQIARSVAGDDGHGHIVDPIVDDLTKYGIMINSGMSE